MVYKDFFLQCLISEIQIMLVDEDEEKPIKIETVEDVKPIKMDKSDTDVAGDMLNELEALMNDPAPTRQV